MARQGATLRSVNAVRCILVLGLVAFQSIEVSESYGRIVGSALWIVPGWSLAALFALAGFTALRSIERHGAATAAIRSAIRLVPALVLVVVASAYVLGPVATSESPRSYLLDGDVAAYLLNILGVPRTTLPGVFQFNAVSGVVNPLLWMVPVSYLAAVVLAASAWRPALRGHLLVGIGALLAIFGVGLFIADVDFGRSDGLAALLLAGRGFCALLCFVAGALVYRFRQAVPIDGRVAGIVGLVLALIALLGSRSWLDNGLVGAGVALPIAYLAIYACSLPLPLRHLAPRLEPLFWRVLLLAYPIQQSWIAFGPARQNGALNFGLSLPTIIAIAAAEWFLFERPLVRRFLPRMLPPAVEQSFDRPVSGRIIIGRARAALPLAAGAVLVVLLVLAALAITMFAMQRDSGGA